VRFGSVAARGTIVTVPIAALDDTAPQRFRERFGIERPYLLYAGRLDESKGVGELVAAHAHFRQLYPDGPDLVILGDGPFKLRRQRWLHALGFVGEQEKADALADALAVVVPSPYESLSLIQLEAWAHGIPTLGNARSAVLVGQSRRSGGGLWYEDRDEYVEMARLLAAAPALARALGQQGRAWVSEHYSRVAASAAWCSAVRAVMSPPPSPLER